MSLPHPIPYQGSKRQLAQRILMHIPANTARLVEPFAGSGAVTIAAAQQGIVHDFWLNDANAPLIELWSHILYQPQTLTARYEQLWQAQLGQERRYYDIVRERFNRTQRPYYLLYLLARCVKAAVRYNAQGEFNQSPDNRRKGRQPDAMRRDIVETAQLLAHNTRLTAWDYRRVLYQTKPEDVVYLDPPYQGVCAARDPRYLMGIDYEDFGTALEDLNTRQIAYLVSYDGRTGEKKFGRALPDALNLTRIELDAGRSSQATLLGRSENTYESLYLSPALVARSPAMQKRADVHPVLPFRLQRISA